MTTKPCVTAAVILAAGGSRRLGQPKQLLPMEGSPLLAHTHRAVLATPNVSASFVVLGANADRIQAAIDLNPSELVINPRWTEGLASSLQSGLQAALKWRPDLDAVLFTLADQPYLSFVALEKLVALGQASADPTRLVTSFYDGHPGAPCWAHASLFPQIMELRGDQGLKPLFNLLPPAQIKRVHLPELATDIDTIDDYQKVLNR